MKQEMIDAAKYAEPNDQMKELEPLIEYLDFSGENKIQIIVSSAIQAAINAAWHTFSPDNPETWPKSEYAPSGKTWLCIRKNSALDGGLFLDVAGFNDAGLIEYSLFPQKRWGVLGIIRYCDPIDFMPADLLPINTDE